VIRNDDYWKPGKPYLDEIYYRVIADAASRALALETMVPRRAPRADRCAIRSTAC
jgi:hypothetical protein